MASGDLAACEPDSAPDKTSPGPIQSFFHRMGLGRDRGTAAPAADDEYAPEPEILEAETQVELPEKGQEHHDLGDLGDPEDLETVELPDQQPQLQPEASKSVTSHATRKSRRVVPGLPRTLTFKRQQSEFRGNLEPVAPTLAERRAVSADRRAGPRPASHGETDAPDPRASAPEFLTAVGMPNADGSGTPSDLVDARMMLHDLDHLDMHFSDIGSNEDDEDDERFANGIPPPVEDAPGSGDLESLSDSEYHALVRDELEHKWILNLSMHFRDKSKREKFFITYRETPSKWRRVTISVDYRGAPDGSLEMELLNVKFQRDKMAKIYEAIRDSIEDIKFYDTATNLKLMTTEGRLHVHVVEDSNEIITYPGIRTFQHVNCRRVKESELEFDCHMSGYVYKVQVDGQTLIKKEIPGPDSVEEFVYEVNALSRLRRSPYVIDFYGIVVDEEETCVKALLLSYAEQGGLVDLIYDNDHSLPWHTRETWARQIVGGLADLHESGFVQGDFTLSNIVIDGEGDAKIIDINRRGCPVGWEPPECTPLIEANTRITMYIGVKSDLFQLGMVLWGLAMQEDEPEQHPRPLMLPAEFPIPRWYRRIVEICLSEDPRHRVEAVHLLSMFPDDSAVDLPESGRQYLDRLNRSTPLQDKPLPSIEIDEGSPGQSHDAADKDEGTSATSGDDQAIVRTVGPNEWAYLDWKRRRGADHTYVADPAPGSDGEPYYYPTRGRSPPSSYYRELEARGSGGRMPQYGSNGSRTRPSYWSDNYSEDATTAPSVSDVHLSREPQLRIMSEDGFLARREKNTGDDRDDEHDTATPKTSHEPFTPVGPHGLGDALVVGEEVAGEDVAGGEHGLVAEALLERDPKSHADKDGGVGGGGLRALDGSVVESQHGIPALAAPSPLMDVDMLEAELKESGMTEPAPTPFAAVPHLRTLGAAGAPPGDEHPAPPNAAQEPARLDTAAEAGETAPAPDLTPEKDSDQHSEHVVKIVSGSQAAASTDAMEPPETPPPPESQTAKEPPGGDAMSANPESAPTVEVPEGLATGASSPPAGVSEGACETCAASVSELETAKTIESPAALAAQAPDSGEGKLPNEEPSHDSRPIEEPMASASCQGQEATAPDPQP